MQIENENTIQCAKCKRRKIITNKCAARRAMTDSRALMLCDDCAEKMMEIHLLAELIFVEGRTKEAKI